MTMVRKSMGDYMLEKGYLSPMELENAKSAGQNGTVPMDRVLMDMGVNPVHVYEAKAQEAGQPFVDLGKFKPEPAAIAAVPEHVVKRYNVLPIKKDGNILYVAMSDTNNLEASDALNSFRAVWCAAFSRFPTKSRKQSTEITAARQAAKSLLLVARLPPLLPA